METHFFALLALLVGVTQFLTYPKNRFAQVAVNTIPLMAVLTRPDGVVFVGAAFVLVMIHKLVSGCSWFVALKDTGVRA